MSHQPKVSNNNNGKIKKRGEGIEDDNKLINPTPGTIAQYTNNRYFERIYNDEYSTNLIYTWGSNEMGK